MGGLSATDAPGLRRTCYMPSVRRGGLRTGEAADECRHIIERVRDARRTIANMAETLRLRPLRLADELEVRAAHSSMKVEGFSFLWGCETGERWPELLRGLTEGRRASSFEAGRVPATFLVAEVGGWIVGRTSIRHELNEQLFEAGGHIGYGVLREHRRRGYATEILRQSLIVARAEGISRVLVTCDDDNLGSAAVIERCGGRLEDRRLNPGGVLKRRYWID
jgi:predicted acetyltransferase